MPEVHVGAFVKSVMCRTGRRGIKVVVNVGKSGPLVRNGLIEGQHCLHVNEMLTMSRVTSRQVMEAWSSWLSPVHMIAHQVYNSDICLDELDERVEVISAKPVEPILDGKRGEHQLK